MAHRYVLALVALAAVAAGQDGADLCNKCGCGDGIINCTGRNISALPPAWPDKTADYTSAIFDHNNLTHVVGFPPRASLRVLSLKDNRIQLVEDGAFQNLTALKELDLSFNDLSSAVMGSAMFRGKPAETPGSLPLGNLTVLHLSQNAIHSLPQETFAMVQGIKVLTLAYNPLKTIDAQTILAITSLMKLEVLDMSFCDLSFLPDDIVHTPQALKVLNLTGNYFTAVPGALKWARAMEELHLGSNSIQVLDNGSFPEALMTVRVLYLNYLVNLTRVEAGALAPLRNLTELHMSHCKNLKTIDARAFASPPNYSTVIHPPLKKLELRGNALERLDPHFLRNHWEELTVLDLQDNMWICDCQAQWMVDTLEDIINDTRPDLLRNVICEQPEGARGKGLFELHVRTTHLQCGGGGLSGTTVAFLGAVVGVLLAVPATLAAILFWRRGGLPWFSSGPAGFSRAFYSRTDSVGDF